MLTPEGIAEELARISRHPYVAPAEIAEPGAEEPAQPAVKNGFNKILALLRRVTGVDFSEVAIRKAEQLAEARGVAVTWAQADLLGYLGTVTSREPSAEEAYDELEVRALTGAGAEGAVSH